MYLHRTQFALKRRIGSRAMSFGCVFASSARRCQTSGETATCCRRSRAVFCGRAALAQAASIRGAVNAARTAHCKCDAGAVLHIFPFVLAAQVGFYAAAVAGLLMERAGRRLSVLAMPLYFMLANVASVVAFYKFLRGERYARWQPIRNTR